MHVSLNLAATLLTVVPACAEVSEVERERVDACFVAREWDCAFDGIIAMYSGPESRMDCLAPGREACWIDMTGLAISAVGATENVGAWVRRDHAERALDIIARTGESSEFQEAKLLLGALRYDACLDAGDETCVSESARFIGVAMADKHGAAPIVEELYGLLSEVGIDYPNDLAKVITEVAEMEKPQ